MPGSIQLLGLNNSTPYYHFTHSLLPIKEENARNANNPWTSNPRGPIKSPVEQWYWKPWLTGSFPVMTVWLGLILMLVMLVISYRIDTGKSITIRFLRLKNKCQIFRNRNKIGRNIFSLNWSLVRLVSTLIHIFTVILTSLYMHRKQRKYNYFNDLFLWKCFLSFSLDRKWNDVSICNQWHKPEQQSI